MTNRIVAQISGNTARVNDATQHLIELAAELGCGPARDSALVATNLLTMHQSDILRVLGSLSVSRESTPSAGIVQVTPPPVSRCRLDSSCPQPASRKSAAASQIQDCGPDRRRQAVPARDKLLECLVSSDIVQPLASLLDASILRRNNLRSVIRVCNSRRLHY